MREREREREREKRNSRNIRHRKEEKIFAIHDNA